MSDAEGGRRDCKPKVVRERDVGCLGKRGETARAAVIL